MPDDSEFEDEIEIEPRAPRVIGLRMIALATVFRRAMLELQVLEGTHDDTEDEDPFGAIFDLQVMIEGESLKGVVSAAERSIVVAGAGKLGEQPALDASWAIESLNALEWA